MNIGKLNPKRFKFGTIVENPKELEDELADYMFCVFRVGIGRSYIQNIKPDYEKAIKDIYEEREKYV